MNRTEQYQPASFAGISFLVPSEDVTRGTKVVVHEFLNSDRRFAEPLGLLPPVYNLRCIVHGEDYLRRRTNLEIALEGGEPGELVHPIYGQVMVQPGEYTVSTSQTEAGKVTFTVPFYATSVEVTPEPLAADETTATLNAAEARDALNDALEASIVEPDSPGLLSRLADAVEGAVDEVNSAIDSVVGPIDSAVAEVNGIVNTVRGGVFRIVQTAAGLRSSLTNLYNTFVQLSTDAQTLTDAWQNLITFGTDEDGNASEPGSTNTATRADAENNDSVIEEHTRIMGLIGVLEGTAHTDFSTTEELQSLAESVNDSYARMFENNTEYENINSLANNPEVRSTVYTLRTSVNQTLNNKVANLWSVQEEKTGAFPLSIIAYRYYGSLDNIDAIVDLNPTVNVANGADTINIVVR